MDSQRLVISDLEILSGTPVFVGTRVPIGVLFENLADGLSLDEILDACPTLKREQGIAALPQAESLLELEKAVKCEYGLTSACQGSSRVGSESLKP